LSCPFTVHSGTIREPVWAGQFYPQKNTELLEIIHSLTEKAASQYKNAIKKHHPSKKIKGIILPHAGYIYSGFTAASSGMLLKQEQFEKVILMGPDHRIGFRNGAISNVAFYQTPLGKIRVHEDAKKLLEGFDIFRSMPESDKKEHSIEVILPFLQAYLKDFSFIPVVLGRGDVKKYADALKTKIDDQTLLVASSDLSHFLNYDEAVRRDKETIDLILKNKKEQLMARDNCACGKIPILVLLEIAQERNWNPVLISYTNSGDTAGDKRRVVGYTTIAFY
jgi:hypothetical protein